MRRSCATPAIAPRVIGKWGLGQPGTTGQPDKQGFDHAFGFLDHRHAHRQFTDHLWRNGERVATDVERDYVNDLFTKETVAFIERDDPRPFFIYLNYTVPHAELRAPEDAVAPFTGKFPEQPFVNPKADGKPTGSRADAALAGLPVAASTARRVRRDDHPDGSRHRPARRAACARAASSARRWSCSPATTARISEGGADPGVLQQLRRVCAASSATSTKAASACR